MQSTNHNPRGFWVSKTAPIVVAVIAIAATVAVAFFKDDSQTVMQRQVQDAMPLSQMHQNILMPLNKCLEEGGESKACVQKLVDAAPKDANSAFVLKALTDAKIDLTAAQVKQLSPEQ